MAHRKNRTKWLVTMSAEDFIELFKASEELELARKDVEFYKSAIKHREDQLDIEYGFKED